MICGYASLIIYFLYYILPHYYTSYRKTRAFLFTFEAQFYIEMFSVRKRNYIYEPEANDYFSIDTKVHDYFKKKVQNHSKSIQGKKIGEPA